MKDTIDHYQKLFESISSGIEIMNKNIIREIRVELLRLSILADPATQELFRSKKKPLLSPAVSIINNFRHKTAEG